MTPVPSLGASPRPQNDDGRDLECRQAAESFIDEILEQSFPASDPPAWGTASSRLGQAVWCSQTDESNCSVHHT
jgi:hypothetical protein